MTKLLDEAIAEIRKLPDAAQDRAAELLLALASAREDAAEGCQLSAEQVAEIKATLRAIEDGTMKFASEEEMAAVWARFGL